MITVFTPSYNRKNTLKKLYDSLLQQGEVKFEWLIVDDGSLDDTKEYIDSLILENKIKINYIYKENGGKQSAYNLGLSKAQGDIFICIDSDDILADNALKLIEYDFDKLKSDDVAGIMYNQGYLNDKDRVIGSSFPCDDFTDTYFNIYHKFSVTGDKLIVLKTSLAKEYPFPLIDGEKFMPEALVYNRISLKYKFTCKNKIMAYKEYLNDGYSANYFNLVKRNPRGNALYYLELYNLEPSFYNVYGYLLFSFFSKEKFSKIIKHPSKIKVLILYIPVFIIYLMRR